MLEFLTFVVGVLHWSTHSPLNCSLYVCLSLLLCHCFFIPTSPQSGFQEQAMWVVANDVTNKDLDQKPMNSRVSIWIHKAT